MTIERYLAAVAAPEVEAAGALSVRVMPWGKQLKRNGQTITYDPGSIEVPAGLIPVVIDHGNGALERVGRITGTSSAADALYADGRLSDTSLGRDLRTLLLDGVLTDVSAGIEVDTARSYVDAAGVTHLFGRLDHVAIVGRGAFSDTPNGSQVLSVHARENGDTMTDTDPAAPAAPTPAPAAPAAPAAPVAEYATLDQFDRLERMIAAASTPTATAPTQKRVFRNLRDFATTQLYAARGDRSAQERMARHVESIDEYAKAAAELLDEYALDDETTTTAAGLVPDYLSTQVITRINARRPYVSMIPSDPIGDHGMSVVYPKVVTKPDVGVQATEKTEVTSQAMDIDPVSVDLVTYAGATDVSLQLIERSQPSFLDLLYRELAGVYAERTDAAAVAAAVAAAGDTAVLADFGADASATWAAIAAGVAAVATDAEDPSDVFLTVAIDRWAQLLTLVDTDGRPLITMGGRGQNQQGAGSLATFQFDFGGIPGVVDPHAAAGTALLQTRDATASLEMTPQQLRAVQVDLLGVNVGVWGLFAPVVKYPDSIYTLTPA